MPSHRPLLLLAALAAVGAVTPLVAQERAAVSSAQLSAAVATSPVPRGEAVRTLLGSEQARKVAGQLGISASDLAARTAAVDNATLDQLAQQGGVTDQDLAGGANNVVISTTALIIILLILILLTT